MLKTKTAARIGVVAAGTLVASSLHAAPAHAADVWKTGDRVSTPQFGLWNPAPSISESWRCPTGWLASSVVRISDDEMWVRDSCEDGRSAIGRVYAPNSPTYAAWTCRNKEGVGTWVRCSFDWPEGLKTNLSGWYNGTTGNQYIDWGSGVSFEG